MHLMLVWLFCCAAEEHGRQEQHSAFNGAQQADCVVLIFPRWPQLSEVETSPLEPCRSAPRRAPDPICLYVGPSAKAHGSALISSSPTQSYWAYLTDPVGFEGVACSW